jgi:hypothetical protein
MDERLRFVARRLDGEKMAVLCREFEISRKTGYKIFNRYKDCGVEGLTDRSRRPYRHARQLPFQIEKAIVQLKIRERLRRKHSDNQGRPSKRAPFRNPASGHPFSTAASRFLASFSGIPEEVACTEACTPCLLLHFQRLMAHVLPQLLFVA